MTRLADYGSSGLVGLLTPQANTTVEPETWALLPQGWSALNARLTSTQATIEARLLDYTRKYVATAAQFANAPIEAILIACTGTSYLLLASDEQQIIDEIASQYGLPCITAAQATVTALKALGAQKIAVLSPYPEKLTELSQRYWESKGFDIVATSGPDLENSAFHPIYAMAGEGVYSAYQRLTDSDADLVLMLGTGMATLGPILRGHQQGLLPALSCNLAMIWAATDALDPGASQTQSIHQWIAGEHWADRIDLLFNLGS